MSDADEASSSSNKPTDDVVEENNTSVNAEETIVSILDEEEREAKALLGWVQAVDDATEEGILSRQVVAIDDLCDGVAFFDILGAVDSTYFRNPHSADTKDNWVLKIGTLKRLYKLVLQ